MLFPSWKWKKWQKLVKIEKFILKTKACDSFSSASMERAHQNYPKNVLMQKTQKIELDGFTKPGLHSRFCMETHLLWVNKNEAGHQKGDLQMKSIFEFCVWHVSTLKMQLSVFSLKKKKGWKFLSFAFLSWMFSSVRKAPAAKSLFHVLHHMWSSLDLEEGGFNMFISDGCV